MRTVNLENYGALADVVSAIITGADLRIASASDLDRMETIAVEQNDVPVLYALTPYTDENITDEDLENWQTMGGK